MNTILKVGAAGALALGAVAAHASISSPSSGASDAILFAEVVNSSGSAVASYAGDTGVSISTFTAGLTGTQTVLGGDANLQKLFTADVGTDTLVWSVQGGQYTGNANVTNFKTAGVAQFVTTATGDSTAGLTPLNTSNLIKWATLNADVSTINTNSGGANSVEGASPATAGVWDAAVPSGTSQWYSNGPATSETYGDGAHDLFYVTGGGSTGAKVLYTSEGTAELTAGGLVLAAPTVPLPAAVWLFGSGLLGLAGVSRRKSKA